MIKFVLNYTNLEFGLSLPPFPEYINIVFIVSLLLFAPIAHRCCNTYIGV